MRTVVSGPQRITYESVDLGGGGGLVGPGAAPTSAPALALAGGAGVTNGSHNVAVTFVTPAGESLPSPIASITVGTLAPPVNAPLEIGVPTIGTGPNAGAHDYATTFVTPSGETTRSPISANIATTTTNGPGSSAPMAGTPTTGGSVDPGSHDYAVSYVTSIGETTPSSISGQVTVLSKAAPSAPPSLSEGTHDVSHTPGTYQVKLTFTFSDGTESLPTSASGTLYTSYDILLSSLQIGPSNVTARNVYMSEDYGAGGAFNNRWVISDNTTTSLNLQIPGNPGWTTASPPTSAPASNQGVPLTGIPVPSDANVTSKWLYRRSGGVGLKRVTSLSTSTTTYTDTMANASLGAAALSTNTAYLQRIVITIPVGGPLVTHVKVYGTAVANAQLKYIATLTNGTTSYEVTTPDASLGANVPTVNTATASQIALTGVQIGAASVTSRKLYMTAVASAQLKLVTTIADNVTSTYTISTADGSLGANVPTSDASGLTQPTGQVLAGSTSLVVAGTGAFRDAGGWAVIGNGQQVIRYAGKTGSALTGIPASGIGAIVASIGYNSTITAAPCLLGIPASGPGSIQHTILKGDPVNLFVQADNVVGQAALAAVIGGDGVQEASMQDRRLSFTEATARAEAHLALHSTAEVSIRYQTRDINTRAGRTISVNLGPPFNVVADFMIQSVTETFPQTNPPINPTFDVVASSSRFSFDDLLRLARTSG